MDKFERALKSTGLEQLKEDLDLTIKLYLHTEHDANTLYQKIRLIRKEIQERENEE